MDMNAHPPVLTKPSQYNKMRIVVITRFSPGQVYFTNTLARQNPIVAIFEEQAWTNNWNKFKRRMHKGVREYGLRTIPAQFMEGVYLYYQQKLSRETEHKFFFNKLPFAFSPDIPRYQVRSINDASAITQLKALKPDVLVVFGSSILRKRVIKIPQLGTFNMHNGILPQYRGAKSEFWALYRNEPEMVGVTIHRIEERVDTGEIVLQAYVLPRPGENERLLRCETIKAGTSLMNQALDQLEKGTVTYLPQEEASAGYYSTPSMQEYRELHRRLNRTKQNQAR